MDTTVVIEPSFLAGHTVRTLPLLELRRYEEAIQEYGAALALNRRLDSSASPNSWLIALHGYAHARMGRPQDAMTMLTQLRSQARAQYGSAAS